MLQTHTLKVPAQCGTQLLALTLYLLALVLIGQHHLLGNVTTVLIVLVLVEKVLKLNVNKSRITKELGVMVVATYQHLQQ